MNYNIFLIIMSLFIPTVFFAQSNSCNADLRVEKDRNSQSTSTNAAALYSMVLTNKSSIPTNYSLNAFNINSTCSNTDGTSSTENVNIETTFLDTNKQPISSISINAGESATFFVKTTVPNGTIYNKWSCTQVNAESTTCSNYKVNTVLHTLVINPNED
ncbi:hypothetical protein [Flavobacterium sp.]|uniref:hypothetical protein n=1 Tax=Flavobacterium sp. TaxID=239 RepID=UPI003C62DA04